MTELELRLHHDRLRLRWLGQAWVERRVNGSPEDARVALREAIHETQRDQPWWKRWFDRPTVVAVLEPDAQPEAVKSVWLRAMEGQPVKRFLLMHLEHFEEFMALTPQERSLKRVRDD